MTSPTKDTTTTPPAADGFEERDIALWDAIAEKWAKKDRAASSRAARKQRLLRTLDAIPVSMGTDARLLEVGCGAGYSADYLKGRYGSFVGIDYSDELIKCARRENDLPNCTFETANLKDYQPEAPFDVVFMIGVLHHVDDMDAAMSQMVSQVKPGGWIVANEPQPLNPLVHFLRTRRKGHDDDYSDEQREIRPSEFRTMFADAGLESIRVVPQGLFSTPFAEVVMNPQAVTGPLSSLACAVDSVCERLFRGLLMPLSWNLVGVGRRPL